MDLECPRREPKKRNRAHEPIRNWTMGHERVILLYFLGFTSRQIAEKIKNGPALFKFTHKAQKWKEITERWIRRIVESTQGQRRLGLLREQLEAHTIDTHLLVQQYYQMLAPEAIQTLADLMRDETDDPTSRRLAATEILHGAGHRPVAHSVVEKFTKEVAADKYTGKSEDEIRALLKAQLTADREKAEPAPPPPEPETVH